MLGSPWLLFSTPATAVWAMSKKSVEYLPEAASLYSAGLIRPRPDSLGWLALLIWSAIATSPAHCGQLSEVPPMSYQPVRPMLLLLPSDRKSTRLNSSHLVISYA